MKTEHLQYMILTAEQGSISKAARLLYMTQPQLSNIIRDMEQSLQFPIFVRKQNGVTPTPQGEQFLLYARRIINETKSIENLRADQSDRLRFHLSSFKSSIVLDCFLQLTEKYKDSPYMFSFFENGNPGAMEDVYNQTSDIGVVFLIATHRKKLLADFTSCGLDYHPITTFIPHIIISQDHPLLQQDAPPRREQFYEYGMLRYAKGLHFGSQELDDIWYSSYLDTSRIRQIIEVSDRATMHNLLANTTCFSIGLNNGIYQEKLHSIVSVPMTDPAPPASAAVEMGYITNSHTDFASNIIANEFVQLLMDAYA